MSDLYIEARLQAIKDIASASCSDIKDADNIAGFCDEIYSAIPNKIMEEIIRQNPSQYIIIRKKGEETEYFSGANIYRRDNDGILRVSKTTWSKTINPMRAPYNQDKMKDILDGMRKYGEIEEEYNYIIAEIQTTTKIINYIEQ